MKWFLSIFLLVQVVVADDTIFETDILKKIRTMAVGSRFSQWLPISETPYLSIDGANLKDLMVLNTYIGAPQGLVGADKDGLLAEFIKAHPDGGVIFIENAELIKERAVYDFFWKDIMLNKKFKDNKDIEWDLSKYTIILQLEDRVYSNSSEVIEHINTKVESLSLMCSSYL